MGKNQRSDKSNHFPFSEKQTKSELAKLVRKINEQKYIKTFW
jgi:hypothetical protein